LIEKKIQLLAKIAEMQKTLDLINYKVNVYDKALLKRENELVLVAE
jgi:hypothetical protein